eukprot:jgi/Mesen1/10069/ME000730S09341
MKFKGLTVAFFYGGMSVASVFINKAIFHVYKFNYPYALVLGQTIFTLVLLTLMRNLGVIRLATFQTYIFRRVFLLSFAFLLKLLLDMSALNKVNIPMYGVLKSSTTPFVLLLDYVMRDKKASTRVQLSVYLTTAGAFVAGMGDLSFNLAGYILALSSALATAAYVVIVGKLGEELQLDSFTLLLYNNCWSLPFSFFFVLVNGEAKALANFPHARDPWFITYFLISCASAFILNLATYLCTLVNDSLTTSIVGRTKSILQGIGGLFAFNDVLMNPTNLLGLLVNSCGIGWYAFEKYLEAKVRMMQAGDHKALNGHTAIDHSTLTRDGSQISLVLTAKEMEKGARERGEREPLLSNGRV